MPNSLTILTTNLPYILLRIDGGTKPSGTVHYKIERKKNGTSAAKYVQIAQTANPDYYDRPRPFDSDGTALTYDYRVKAYNGSGYDSGIADTSGTAPPSATDTLIGTSGILEPSTSSGNITNSYLSQNEAKPPTSTDENSWIIQQDLPLSRLSA